MHERPDTTSLPAKMKISPQGRKNALRAQRVPSLALCGCISFFAAQRDAFCRQRKIASMQAALGLETALARGDSGAPSELEGIRSGRASFRQRRRRESKRSHERQRPPLSDHRACRRRGRAHALGPAQGPARARGPLDAGARALNRPLRARWATSRSSSGRTRDGVAAEALKAAPEAKIAVQRERRGTADAVLAARDQIERGYDDILVLYADTPLIEASTLDGDARRARLRRGCRGAGIRGRQSNRLWPPHRAQRTLDRDPGGEGCERRRARLTPVQRRADRLQRRRGAEPSRLRSSPTTPRTNIYLTDIVEIANARGLTARVAHREREGGHGRQRPGAARRRRGRRCRIGLRRRAMAAGATLTAPETVFLSFDTTIGRDVLIEPHVVIGPGCTHRGRRGHPRLLASRGRAGRGRRDRRAVRAPQARRGHRGQRENRQFR